MDLDAAQREYAEYQRQHRGAKPPDWLWLEINLPIDAEQLRCAMKAHGATREQLAEACGVSPSAVRRWTKHGVPKQTRIIRSVEKMLPSVREHRPEPAPVDLF